MPPCERAEGSWRRREPCVERRAFARRVRAERLGECRRERECERAGERRVAGAAAASERARKRRAGARPGRPDRRVGEAVRNEQSTHAHEPRRARRRKPQARADATAADAAERVVHVELGPVVAAGRARTPRERPVAHQRTRPPAAAEQARDRGAGLVRAPAEHRGAHPRSRRPHRVKERGRVKPRERGRLARADARPHEAEHLRAVASRRTAELDERRRRLELVAVVAVVVPAVVAVARAAAAVVVVAVVVVARAAATAFVVAAAAVAVVAAVVVVVVAVVVVGGVVDVVVGVVVVVVVVVVDVVVRKPSGLWSATLREKITPECWVIASAKSVLLSRVLLLKKNGYFYPDRVPIPEYSGFNDTIRYFLYS